MDTKETKLTKGAIADLLQKPHIEVAGSKTPAISSDEERLAAGISMIGLQTKKPFGAQWRKLTRERKMKEGTWTENPPRKTPPSQAKGTVGSSGGGGKTPLSLEHTIPTQAA